MLQTRNILLPKNTRNNYYCYSSTQFVMRLEAASKLDEKVINPPWWNRRSRLERTLCGVTIVSILMFAAMGVALTVVGLQYQKNIESRRQLNFPSEPKKLVTKEATNKFPSKSEICLTPGCVKAAASILSNIDDKVDPCDNFYQFACGGWVDRQVIPEDKSSLSVFSVLQDELNQKLRIMVEKPLTGGEPDFIKMLKDMYTSCMDLPAVDKAGAQPLKDVLKILGGWPVVEGKSWDPSRFDWLDTLLKFRQMGYSHDILIDLSVTPDYRNNTYHIIDIDQTSLGMPDRTYMIRGLNDSSVAAYFKLMVESAVMLGADRATAQQELEKSLNFEINLANFSLPREERRNISKLYNKMTIKDLYGIVPQVNWLKYMNGLLTEEVTEDEPIIVNVPAFLEKFGPVISSVDQRVLANYMIWRVVGQSLTVLNRPWRDLAQDYSSVITGKSREEPRWEQCLSSLTGSLGVALGSLYVKEHFKEESKGSAVEMVDYIHKEFLKIVEEVDWMDPKTRERAKDKAKAITPYIGYPNEVLDKSKVAAIYENLTVTINSYFQNIQNIRKWSTDYAFNQLRKPNEKGDWKKHARAAVVNAYYNSLENSIEFPAGILQGSFFSKDRPNYMNYGAVGFVIGHEITHGFDDRGRQFDKDGNNLNWWEPETDIKFKDRAECIVNQYGNYSVPETGLNVNGINTQGENIADNGGLKEAFRAYNAWVKDQKEPELPLPGLNYTPNQLFWISAANVWCGKYRPEVLKLRILTGAHSPSQFRVIGPVSNLPDFSKEFGCPLGSPMNPVKKCEVW